MCLFTLKLNNKKMITQAVLKVYTKYSGDGDAFSRVGTKKEREIFKDIDFYTIDDLIQDIKLINNGLASNDFKEK